MLQLNHMLKDRVKQYLLPIIALVIDSLMVLIFLIWFLADIMNLHDVYIPWLLLLFSSIFITNLVLMLIIRFCLYDRKIYIVTFIVSIIHCILIVGLPTGILFLCDATKRRHYSNMKQVVPVSVACILALPLVAIVVYSWVVPTPWQKFNENDQTGASNINPAEWMKYLSDDEQINEVSIPGTHDSLSQLTNERPWYEQAFTSGNFNNGWAKTQGYSLKQQLERGVRSFHMRFDKNGYAYHGEDANGVVSSYDIKEDGEHITYYETMYTIASFLKLNKTEFVLPGDNILNYPGASADRAEIEKQFPGMISDEFYDKPTVGELRGHIVEHYANISTFESPFPRPGWNTLMWDAYKIWNGINKTLGSDDVSDPIESGGTYIEWISFTGWNILNMRNNPMQAAHFINNLVIGKCKQFALKHDKKIGWWTFDTDYGDLEPNHNIAAAIYLVNDLNIN